nr:20 kDa chaperonin, chloroplastic-like [Tanacetum cinerariifolium]
MPRQQNGKRHQKLNGITFAGEIEWFQYHMFDECDGGLRYMGNYAGEETNNSYNGDEAISYVLDESVVLQRNINDTAREEWRSRANEGRRSNPRWANLNIHVLLQNTVFMIEAFWQNNELYLNYIENTAFQKHHAEEEAHKKPLGDKVLVEINAVEDKIAGGILLSTIVKTSMGEVVAIGEVMIVGLKQVEVNVKNGEKWLRELQEGCCIDIVSPRRETMKHYITCRSGGSEAPLA